jgi:hypothetical protein
LKVGVSETSTNRTMGKDLPHGLALFLFL